jgi:hypothetical protein
VILPERFLTDPHARARKRNTAPLLDTVKLHEAPASKDPNWLAQAIDHAASRGLIPHAARMRIVLGEMSRERSLLERARPVLQGLKDRQFLRRLDEVAASLEAKAIGDPPR